MTEEGISGSYFLENVNRHRVAIFKPLDEEPYAPNNPKGYVGNYWILLSDLFFALIILGGHDFLHNIDVLFRKKGTMG